MSEIEFYTKKHEIEGFINFINMRDPFLSEKKMSIFDEDVFDFGCRWRTGPVNYNFYTEKDVRQGRILFMDFMDNNNNRDFIDEEMLADFDQLRNMANGK